MKKIIFCIYTIAFLFIYNISYSQTTIYSENFGFVAGVFLSGWTTTGTQGTTGWGILITNPSSGYTGSSGGANLKTGSTVSTSMTVTYSNNLSTVGFSNITVLWGGRRTSTQTSPTFEWSSNGATWNSVTFTDVTANSTWALVNGGTRIVLPSGAAGISNLRLRWTTTVLSGPSEYRIDDLTVQGTCSNSTAATSATTNLTTVCAGSPAVLSIIGGSAGLGALWYWYSGSCGGTLVGTGATTTQNPTVTTTYYCRAENYCNTTTCASKVVTVTVAPTMPTITPEGPTSFCQGDNVSLDVSTQTGVIYQWYRNSTIISGSVNTIYVATIAGSYTVQVTNGFGCSLTSLPTVVTISTYPTATITPQSATTFCQGDSVIINVNSGTGYTYQWKYNGGNISGATGLSITADSTGYYSVDVTSTICTTTSASVLVTANSLPSALITPQSSTTICQGNSVLLDASIGYGYLYQWYNNGSAITGGTNQGYYATTVGNYSVFVTDGNNCSNTSTSVAVNVNIGSVAASSASSLPSLICLGSSSTLSLTGGSLGTNAIWRWYSGSCGGTLVGTGITLNLYPLVTNTYYIRAEGTCNSTLCVSTTITVNTNSVAVTTVITTPSSICTGSSSTLSFTGGSLGIGAIWYWYSGSCGGTIIGTGTTVTVSPLITTSYFVRAEGYCNTTKCVTAEVIVNTFSTAGSSVTSTPSVICPGFLTTLNVTGGSLGTAANWNWYTGSCGGAYVMSGSSPILYPLVTTTYWVRAEGSCNTTTCLSTIVTVNTNSIAPTSASASPSLVCAGFSSVLSISGGSLGIGAIWNWYTGSCGGTYLATGISLTLNPVITTTYWARAEGTCNTTTCVSKTVLVNTFSISGSSAISSPSVICLGSFSSLNISGGSLGTAAIWKWYTGSCGSTYVTSGILVIFNPTITTTYWVRAEGTCNTTICVSTTITVNTNSTTPTSSTAIPSQICQGVSSTLSLNGGILGTGAVWNWYLGACGGAYIISGASPVLFPMVNTTYWVRAEGACNTTSCISISITVDDSSAVALSATSTQTTICKGNSTLLSLSGGNLGTGANWYWYSGYCGGTIVGSGINLNVTPGSTIDYYVRAEGTCNTTNCISISITVNDSSIVAASLTSTQMTICEGLSAGLSFTGGSLGAGAGWYWYSGYCGGTFEGSGINLTVLLTATIDYYVRAEGACNTTNCISITIAVNDSSEVALSVSSTQTTICEGSSAVLSVTGGNLGAGANWFWYSGNCGGTFEGSGINFSITPITTTDYYVRAEGICNTTNCVSLSITVNDSSETALSINSAQTSICEGSLAILNVTGGHLGVGADWHWYSGSCAGTNIGSGTNITVTPAVTTNYYVKAVGICNISNCVSISIIVNDSSNIALSISFSQTTICQGTPITLNQTGGLLGTGAIWYWYSGYCGGTIESSGSSLTVTPAISVSYYVRAEGICNTTNCISLSITVNDSSSVALSVTSAQTTICKNSSATLNLNGGILGTGADWYWYSGVCDGTIEGSGLSINVSPILTTTYFVRAEGTCNITACVSITITVLNGSLAANSATISQNDICQGTSVILGIIGGSLGNSASWFWYAGTCGGIALGTGSSLTLIPDSSSIYFIRAEGICNTTTCISVAVTVKDSSIVASTIIAMPDSLCKGLQTTLKITDGSLGYDAGWYWFSGSCGGTFMGSGLSVTVTPNSTTNYYIRAQGYCNTTICTSKTVTVLTVPVLTGIINGNPNPLKGDTEVYFVEYIQGVTYTWSAPSGWIGSSTTDSITYIVGNKGLISVTPSNSCGTGPVLTLNINISGIFTETDNEFLFDNYPNPFDNFTQIEFELPVSALVTIDLYNILGVHITNITDDFYIEGKHVISLDASKLPSGLYPYKIRVSNNKKVFTKTKIMNIVR